MCFFPSLNFPKKNLRELSFGLCSSYCPSSILHVSKSGGQPRCYPVRHTTNAYWPNQFFKIKMLFIYVFFYFPFIFFSDVRLFFMCLAVRNTCEKRKWPKIPLTKKREMKADGVWHERRSNSEIHEKGTKKDVSVKNIVTT